MCRDVALSLFFVCIDFFCVHENKVASALYSLPRQHSEQAWAILFALALVYFNENIILHYLMYVGS